MEVIVLGLIVLLGGSAFWYGRQRRNQRAGDDRRRRMLQTTEATERLHSSRQRPAPLPRSLEYRAERTERLAIKPSGASDGLIIEYADAYGVVTDREIRDAKVESIAGVVYVSAFCLLRGERRNFRADRVMTLTTSDGTKVNDPHEFFAARTRGARQIRVIEIPAEHKRAMARVKPTLDALIWIARADREVDADEMHVLLDYIEARIAIGRGKDKPAWDRHLAGATIDEAKPIKVGAVKALLDIGPDSPQAALFRETAQKLIGEDAGKANRYAQLLKTWN